jgi:hypothetical protein
MIEIESLVKYGKLFGTENASSITLLNNIKSKIKDKFMQAAEHFHEFGYEQGLAETLRNKLYSWEYANRFPGAQPISF